MSTSLETSFVGTVGATLTTTNHGGSAFAGVSGTATFVSPNGVTATASAYGWWDFVETQVLARRIVTIPTGTIASEYDLLRINSTTVADQAIRVGLLTTGALRLYAYNPSGAYTVATSSVLPRDTPLRVVVFADANADTIRMVVYSGATSTTVVYDTGLLAVTSGYAAPGFGRTRVLVTPAWTLLNAKMIVGSGDVAFDSMPLTTPIVGDPTMTSGLAVVDSRAMSGGSGPLSFSISPMSGVTEAVEGLFLIAQTSSAVTYTVTATDGTSSVTRTVVVPAATVASARGLVRLVRRAGSAVP